MQSSDTHVGLEELSDVAKGFAPRQVSHDLSSYGPCCDIAGCVRREWQKWHSGFHLDALATPVCCVWPNI